MAHTKLTQMKISDMDEAVSIFARNRGYGGETPLVLVPSRSCLSMCMTIPDGVHAVGQRCGEDIGLLPAGFTCLPSWYRVAFLVSRQSTVYDIPVQSCPTKDNVMVQADLALVFSIEDARKFVYNLSAVKFDELLSAATEEAIRGLIRSVPHDKIYELRGSKASDFLASLNSKFEIFGVKFTDATVTDVKLPAELSEALERETTYDSKQKEQAKKQEFEIKKLNDKADLDLKGLRAQNDRAAKDELARKERALIQQGQAEIEAQKAKQLAIIKAEEEASVLRFKAEAELINSKTQGEKDAALLTLKAKGESQAAKIRVDQEAQIEETRAKADLAAAENRAKALLVEAEAEEKASTQLKEKRAHDLELAKLDVLEKVARNGKIVVSGESGDKLIKTLVSGDLSQL